MLIPPTAFRDTYQGEQAVWLKYDQLEAVVLPEIGANLIAFRDVAKGCHFLHEPLPEEMEEFKARPIIHGIPVLFPPNRYDQGIFAWNGHIYQFPVNEPSTGNHLHGFLYQIPWHVEYFGANETESKVSLILQVNEDHPVFHYFPHVFTIRLEYSLSRFGLLQHVMIINEGAEIMPYLLAFHTAINAPFMKNASASDYRCKITIGQRLELNDRMLPTQKTQKLTSEEERLKESGISPFFEAMDNHYTAEPQNGRNRMELTDTRNKITLVYDVGTSYKHWMIWNNQAREGFFCPEPQINLVNAPNVPLPPEESALFSLHPGEIWEETSRFYVSKL